MGFKPETMAKKILPALGYDGPMDSKSIQAFLAASPAAAAKMGKYTMAARRMIEQPVNAADGITMASGKPIGRMTPYEVAVKAHGANSFAARHAANKVRQSGSSADKVRLNKQIDTATDTQGRSGKDAGISKIGPRDIPSSPPSKTVQQAPVYTQQAPVYTTSPGSGYSTGPSFSQMLNTSTGGSGNVAVNPVTGVPTIIGSGVNEGLPKGSELTRQIMDDPTKPVTVANVVSDDGGEAALIPLGTGQAGETREAVPLQFADPAQAAQVTAPDQIAQIDPAMSADAVAADMQARQAAEGQVNEQAQIAAEQIDPNAGSALGLEAAQLEEATQVQNPLDLQATPDQLVSGPTVDRQQVGDTFGRGEIKAASVKDELAGLMEDFESEGTPTWAAGAMRAANAAMAARGLSMTSIAGMAVTQAAMEAALPIAQMDAANKQEMALMKAEQRARFMNMEFDQAFQAKVINAARVSEIANLNFSAAQQIALENARLTQTVDLSNLSNRQAKVMADAATMSQMDMANLDNRQQAAVLNAQSFLQMDLSNLDNNQQMTMFKAQEAVNSILSDTASMNAARQFNASSQNQSDQFFANLGSQVNQFNAEQLNAMERFNAGEANALSQFNAQQTNARDQFNAQNHLIIAQANAQWAQAIATAANAAANQANRDAAMAANNLTMTAYNNVIQRERDLLAWAWASADNAKERDKAIAVATIASDGDGAGLVETAAGSFLGKVTSRAVDLIFPAP